ncbi:MAG: SUF system Fe-S cluster assembly protein [Euryarchaeota archaeon]|uniref:SUF system Fe-S cluster assembly protein n=1 Tax=Marine Group III euryarchaeote CG-Epi2 TaxID=1888996 RepID=A0A1J5U2A4_9ARCH|nr:SUF system Fe-S cluster assembly protein [Euryarchaeota archaeon]OIR22560.1 MAG: SUF system Fe-S cluster assembly protein [Marine Group III euryarchaeote CG-Epi2]|tara:strand:- start:399 stop:722 length:324 start_codon:yes stop_codon:yes gene_type:complete
MSEKLKDKIVEAISKVFDPEIPVNIYELGLIYNIDIKKDKTVEITMTLTSPFCPVAGSLPKEVAARASEVEGVTDANVELVFEPPWSLELMSEEAKFKLNLSGNFMA